MKLWERLLSWLGYRGGEGRRFYELDADLHAALVDLAEQEQRPPEELQAELLERALAQRHTHGELWGHWQSLTPREQDVAALTCWGYTNRQIAARLGVSPETVKTHLRNALTKFNLHAKAELRMALEEWDFSGWE